MKRITAIILASMLLLSLCACGSQKQTVEETKESILENATAIDLDQIGTAFRTNKVNAEDAYYNKFYTIVGAVYNIESDAVLIDPVDAVFDNGGMKQKSPCTVKLPEDEIKSLSNSSVIMVCGKLTYFENQTDSYTLTLEDAFYVTDVIEVTATVKALYGASGEKKTLQLERLVYNSSGFREVYYEIPEYRGPLYSVGDTVTFTGTMKGDYDTGLASMFMIGCNFYHVTRLDEISKN